MKTLKTVLIALVLSISFTSCSKDECGCERITYKSGEIVVSNPVDCTYEVGLTPLNNELSYEIKCSTL